MVKFIDTDVVTDNRKSSKGNQLKFKRDDIWYKADYTGYEGLTEYVVSKLLGFSSLSPDEYVDYELEKIEYNGQYFNACRSKDFTDGWQLITLERLFMQIYGRGLNNIIYSIPDHTERLETLVKQVERVTGLSQFGKYMNKILTVDALFLNEDRHTHNIAVLTKNMKEYRLAPVFDNGAGLLSDTTMEYPLSIDHIKLIDRVKPKTFSDSFEQQVMISEKLYGCNIHFNFNYNDICKILEEKTDYPKEITNRVIEVIMQMRRKYVYLFDQDKG